MAESAYAHALLVWFRNSLWMFVDGFALKDEHVIASVREDVMRTIHCFEHPTYEALITGRDAVERLYCLSEQHHARPCLVQCYQAHTWMCQQLDSFALLQW